MTLLDLLQRPDAGWTDTDRRLVEALIAKPRETAFLSANELARRASAHPASAVRLARKLGFDGYPPLRARLQMELFGVSEAAERMRKRIENLGTGSVLKTLVESEIRMLGGLPGQISDTDIRNAARIVAGAGQTFLFAVGHAVALSHLLEARLGRLGYRTRVLSHVARDIAVNLLQARPGDAFVLFAFNDVHTLVPRIMGHARTIGAKTILITDLTGLAPTPRPDVLLAATRGEESEPRSLVIPMTLCNALMLHVSRLKQRVTMRNLKTLDRLRRKMAGP